MCLLLFAHDIHPRYRLVLAANRDEFYARPAAPAAAWPGSPQVVAGRDLEGGGTWLGVTTAGRWAAVTNFREVPGPAGERSRGHLVREFLQGDEPAEAYASRVAMNGEDYAGFNLVVGDAEAACWISNRSADGPVSLPAGIYGVSNHLLDTPWPKVVRGKRQLESMLIRPDPPEPTDLLDLLMDRTVAVDHDLPSTGVPLELEKALSAAFISTPGYGTRCSTAVLMDREGSIFFAERRYDEGGIAGETRLRL